MNRNTVSTQRCPNDVLRSATRLSQSFRMSSSSRLRSILRLISSSCSRCSVYPCISLSPLCLSHDGNARRLGPPDGASQRIISPRFERSLAIARDTSLTETSPIQNRLQVDDPTADSGNSVRIRSSNFGQISGSCFLKLCSTALGVAFLLSLRRTARLRTRFGSCSVAARPTSSIIALIKSAISIIITSNDGNHSPLSLLPCIRVLSRGSASDNGSVKAPTASMRGRFIYGASALRPQMCSIACARSTAKGTASSEMGAASTICIYEYRHSISPDAIRRSSSSRINPNSGLPCPAR